MSKVQKNEFEISGEVLFVGEADAISEKFSVRLLVIKGYIGDYPQEIPIQYVNDRMAYLDGIRVGDWVNTAFALRGKKSTDRNGKDRWWPTLDGKSAIVEP